MFSDRTALEVILFELSLEPAPVPCHFPFSQPLSPCEDSQDMLPLATLPPSFLLDHALCAVL